MEEIKNNLHFSRLAARRKNLRTASKSTFRAHWSSSQKRIRLPRRDCSALGTETFSSKQQQHTQDSHKMGPPADDKIRPQHCGTSSAVALNKIRGKSSPHFSPENTCLQLAKWRKITRKFHNGRKNHDKNLTKLARKTNMATLLLTAASASTYTRFDSFQFVHNRTQLRSARHTQKQIVVAQCGISTKIATKPCSNFQPFPSGRSECGVRVLSR